ncbi:MAG: START-like domain-containing protein [Paludibacter sp.]|nr:START-like domain-containing protein [Paludibacter sp.]
MSKVEFQIEYLLKNASLPILWNTVGTPLGLSEWFADDVSADNDNYVFYWEKHPQTAKLIGKKQHDYIRFQWEEDEDTDYFFEIRITTIELTKDLILTVTDFAEEDEMEDLKLLWNHQIDALKRKTGL